METRTLDLANLIERLAKSFPTLSRVYLFGSRLYQTGSARSDIDILIEFTTPFPSIPQLNSWISDNEPYIDIFVMHGGSATSAINGSQIAMDSHVALLAQLNAEVVWERGDWIAAKHREHKVLDNWAPVPTVVTPGTPPIKAIDIPPPCDYLVVTALRKEHDAVRQKVKSTRPWKPAGQIAPTFEVSVIRTISGRDRHIALAIFPRMGMASAALTTRSLIDFLDPGLVILVGIAGGISRDDLNLGDLVIPDAIFDYEAVKVTSDGEKSNAMIAPVSPSTYRSIKEKDLSSWTATMGKKRPKTGLLRRWWMAVQGSSIPDLRIHFDGPMASGHKVIADSDRATALRESHRKTASVDMESWGVAEACAFSPTPTPFVAVKAISDYADEKKGDDWQTFCCHASASLVVELIRQDAI